MNYKEYLSYILSKKQLRQLDKLKVIIIGGKQVPTGKTTLKWLLQRKGYVALEAHEFVNIRLDKQLENQISCFNEEIKL